MSDVDDGTKALIVAKDVDRMMQMMETIGNTVLAENLFDRKISSALFLRWVKALASDPRPLFESLCWKNLLILNCFFLLYLYFNTTNQIAAEL